MASPSGDSYQCASGGVIAGGRPAGKSGRIVVAGDSLTDMAGSFAGYRWGLPLIGSPLLISYNAGVFSNTIEDLINRWATTVLAYNPDIVMIRIGTNSGNVPTATWQAQYDWLISSLLENGIFGVFHAVPPRAGTLVPRAMSDYLSTACAAHLGHLVFIDDSVDLGYSDYSYNPAYYIVDGVHMSDLGEYSQGKRMATVLRNVFQKIDPRIKVGTDTYEQSTSSNQYLRNPLFTGTGGTLSGVTGVAPTHWTIARSGAGTAVTSSIVAADPGDSVQIPWLRLTPTAVGGADHEISVYSDTIHPAFLADMSDVKRFDLVTECRLAACNGAVWKNIEQQGTAGSAYVAPANGFGMVGCGILNETITLRTSLARDFKQEPVAIAANSLRYLLRFTFQGASAGGIGSIDLRCASVRGLPD